MKKSDRELVFSKYNGRCAYCGCELKKGWHVDHIEPRWHNWTEEEIKSLNVKKGKDSLENFNPSCPRCNKWKGTWSIEEFRREIGLQAERLQSYNANFRMALDYGTVAVTNKKVEFYFEKV